MEHDSRSFNEQLAELTLHCPWASRCRHVLEKEAERTHYGREIVLEQLLLQSLRQSREVMEMNAKLIQLQPGAPIFIDTGRGQ